MKRGISVFLAGLSVAVSLMLPGMAVFRATPSAAASKVIDWNEAQIRWYSFNDGLREAQATGRPILAVFFAEWCPHCLGHSRLFRNPQIVRLSQALVMVKVDGDRYPEISARYAPDGAYIPRTMVLGSDGRVITSLHGSSAKYRYFLNYETEEELAGIMRGAAGLR